MFLCVGYEYDLDSALVIYLFGVVQVISRRVIGRAEETSTYSSLGLCTVNCRPTASNYQLSHLRLKLQDLILVSSQNMFWLQDV